MSRLEFDAGQTPRTPSRWVILRKSIVAAIVLAIIGGAAAVSVHWMRNKPTAQRRPRAAEARLVQVETVQPQPVQVVVRAMGTVKPARCIDLAGRVGGEIVELADRFVPGGQFAAGETAVRIDPQDYELALRRAETQAAVAAAAVASAAAEIGRCQTELTQAQAELAMEMGAQEVAAREYELLGAELTVEDQALVLREPQLRKAQAACEAAEAAKRKAEAAHTSAVASQREAEVAIEEARLNLRRTAVQVPFDAVVQARHVDLGMQVSASTALASMVGTDEYWVEASVPVDELRWIRIPGFNSESGSPVRVCYAAAWGPDVCRAGVVKRLMTDVESEGRMARLLVSVEDPLDLKTPQGERRPLILGGYVRVEIDGSTLPEVFRVRREHLRSGDTVWVMGPDDKLRIRNVTIAWSGSDDVCVRTGLSAGDRLVVSDLGAAVEGMMLRTAGSPASQAAEAPASQ